MKKWIYTGNPLSISSTCLNNNGYSAFSISTHAQMKTRNSAFSWKLHGTKGIRSVTCRHPTGNYNIPAVSWPIPWVYRPRSPLFHLIVWDVPRIILWTRREENAFDHCGPLQSKTNLPFLKKAHKISNKFTLQHFSKTFVWLQSTIPCHQRKSLSFFHELIKANAWLDAGKVTCKSHPTVLGVLSLLLFRLQAHVSTN